MIVAGQWLITGIIERMENYLNCMRNSTIKKNTAENQLKFYQKKKKKKKKKNYKTKDM